MIYSDQVYYRQNDDDLVLVFVESGKNYCTGTYDMRLLRS